MRDPQTFADLLRAFRVRAGLSQEDLAESAQISVAAIGALERGVRRAPYRSTIALLANALRLNEEDAAALDAARKARRGPPARSGDVAVYLPMQRTSFVGRVRDITHVIAVLDRSRLVTLTGSGGIGKTRAALEVGARVLGDRWGEVWFVDLAPLTDGAFIAPKIASSIHPLISDRVETIRGLASALGERRMLLIFDNCEQVVGDVAEAADTILTMCPNVTILATSRERLNIAGEFVYRLQSLSLPETMPDQFEDARSYSAVDLFVQRAEAADPRLRFSSENIGAIVDIARRLDGIPLAIELAAAQLTTMGLKTLHARLDAQFKLPTGRRDLPARQQTLVATITWSYDLLSAEERELLRGISVFSGGFTLEAAEIVCANEALDRSSILPALSSLIDKSLVNVAPEGDGARYALLESVRSFAFDRLREAGEETKVARRHAQWLADLGDEINTKYPTEMPHSVALGLVPEIDNVRAALTSSLNASSRDDAALAGRILDSLYGLWSVMGRRYEHRKWVEAALASIDEERHPLVVAKLLQNFITRAHYETSALDALDRLQRLCDRLDDPTFSVSAYTQMTTVLAEHGRLSEAEHCSEHTSALIRETQMLGTHEHKVYLSNRSVLRMRQGRLDEARADVAASKRLALSLGDEYYAVFRCYPREFQIEFAAGNTRGALDVAERMLASDFGTIPGVAVQGLEAVTNFRLLVGDVNAAAVSLRELLSRIPADEGFVVEYAATVAAMRGHILVASKLAGFVAALEERLHMRRDAIRQATHELLYDTLREHVERDDIAAVIAAGARLTPEQATAEAVAALDLES